MKQSAVEWLMQQIALKHGAFQAIAFYEDNFKEFEQAKAMDEKNIKDSFIAGAEIGEMFNNENRCFVSDSDKYYEETFKSE